MSFTLIQNLQHTFQKLIKAFWRYPNRLNALRATISMALLSIPLVSVGKAYFGVTLALGALAGALSETNDHPRGRAKSLVITIISFALSSTSVALLSHTPAILGIGFILSTICFILIGGISERYRAITFGSIMIGIYAMLGIENSPAWYWHASLLPAGALFHGLVTLGLLVNKPYRLLDEQMAKGFTALSYYLETKASLFPSNKAEEESISKELALLNINVVSSLEKIKEVLNNYSEEVKDQEKLRPYLQRFMLLQSLHERAASSHDRHEKLGNEQESIEIVEGFGEMIRQLANATQKLAQSLLNETKYHHPLTLDWISEALEVRLQKLEKEVAEPLVLLHHNLYRSHLTLKFLDNDCQGNVIPRLRKDERSFWERIKAQLTFSHPRMRYAIRLSLAFLAGFILVSHFHWEKGAWIMLTSLFVSQITYIDTRRRLFQRILGTATGVVMGVLLTQVVTTTSGQVILMLLSAMAFFYWLRTKYSVAVIFITIFVLFAFNLIVGDGGIHMMLPRLLYTIFGASLSFITIRFLWPGWQYRRIPGLILKALQKNKAYFDTISKELIDKKHDDLAYRIARREAHLAENDLAQAWYSMRLEPKSKQKLMQYAFTLTYLNHALLSYISALGIQRDNIKISPGQISDLKNQISEALQVSCDFLDSESLQQPPKLSPLLINLKQQIVKTEPVIEKQQVRLFYSITGITNKIVIEIFKIKKQKIEI